MLGGLVYDSWRALDRLYRVGAGRYFDVAAVHPFTRHAEDVPRILEYARLQMRFNGDRRKPLLVTELTWPSAAGKAHPPSPFDVSEEQQAENLRVAFRALTADRVRLGIAGVYWYTWASPDRGDWSFSYAGLRRDVAGGSVPKPAYDAFVETVRELRAR